MKCPIWTLALAAIIVGACSPQPIKSPEDSSLLVFGASGRIGGAIVTEALLRGYQVTGVTRARSRLEGKFDAIKIIEGDILDRARLAELIGEHDAVLVSVGGRPTSQDPARYIAATAAQSLIDILEPMGDSGPRLLFVGNLYTLKNAQGVSLIDQGIADGHRNEAMFRGHQIALERFRASQHTRWTIATPPNGLRLSGRTGHLLWGEDTLLVDDSGTPLSISPEDFAFAMLEEFEAQRYEKKRFTVARDYQ
ncbi:MAG: NAD(P)-dependent oxidoreductase [Lysobacterales bacterium]